MLHCKPRAIPLASTTTVMLLREMADASSAEQRQMLSGNGILQHVDFQALVYPSYDF